MCDYAVYIVFGACQRPTVLGQVVNAHAQVTSNPKHDTFLCIITSLNEEEFNPERIIGYTNCFKLLSSLH